MKSISYGRAIEFSLSLTYSVVQATVNTSNSSSSSSSSSNIPDSFVGGAQFKHSPSDAGHNVTGLSVVSLSFAERTRTPALTVPAGQIEFLPTKFCFLVSSNDSKISALLKKS